ncbi:MAG: hypothetical protein E6Q98_19855 [Rhodospirillaceae bacterium]|nr:MAG: hypothetical protein E6Q98_19855 [Rhodospirillaceae bacterium]
MSLRHQPHHVVDVDIRTAGVTTVIRLDGPPANGKTTCREKLVQFIKSELKTRVRSQGIESDGDFIVTDLLSVADFNHLRDQVKTSRSMTLKRR